MKSPYRIVGYRARVAKAIARSISAHPREKWDQYFYWQAELDGYVDLIKESLAKKDAQALFDYWEEQGIQPDRTTSAIFKKAEKKHFGRCVENEL